MDVDRRRRGSRVTHSGDADGSGGTLLVSVVLGLVLAAAVIKDQGPDDLPAL
jgi:hypothetical protein